MGSSSVDKLSTVVKYLGLVAGILTTINGIISIFRTGNLNLKFEVPKKKESPFGFINNTAVNIHSALSVAPSSLAVYWGPVLLGLITILMNETGAKQIRKVASQNVYYIIWFLYLGIFANLGYCGVFGVLTSSYCFLVCILAAVAHFLDNKQEFLLNWDLRKKASAKLGV